MALALLASAAPASAAEFASPIGGIFALGASAADHWGWSGAWRYPVGDPRDFRAAGPAGERGYSLLRGVGGPDEGTSLHQGADLGCGQGGGPVRSAAGGIVLLAQGTPGTSGYGAHVVLGHRLPGGRLAYTIYAHLALGTIPVHRGQYVAAGTRLGRVGQSGRATTPHLHFEVRLASAPGLRWEKEQVLDPIEFVVARLPVPADGDTAARYFEWAQYAGLIDGADAPAAPLRRDVWWRMLAMASRQPLDALPADTGALSESLVSMGLLPEGNAGKPGGVVQWKQVARDLHRLKKLGLRLPTRPLPSAAHHAACAASLGVPDPGARIDQATGMQHESPTVGTALLLLADLAPAPAAPKVRRKGARRHPAARHPGARHSGDGPRP